MTAKWIEFLTGSLEQKKQYRQHLARIEALPAAYAAPAAAFTRYFLRSGAVSEGDALVAMIGDHADLWERAAIDETPLRDVVGSDPVEFAETFIRSYVSREAIHSERERLRNAVDLALGSDGAGEAHAG